MTRIGWKSRQLNPRDADLWAGSYLEHVNDLLGGGLRTKDEDGHYTYMVGPGRWFG